MKTRRILSLVLAILCVLPLLAACGKSVPETPPASESDIKTEPTTEAATETEAPAAETVTETEPATETEAGPTIETDTQEDPMTEELKRQNMVRDPRNPDNVLIYTCSVLEYGAVGDGETDNTAAIQKAIDTTALGGGGTVYIPAGQYVIKGTLTVKRSVYLVGEWYNPETQPEQIGKGTVLLATGNKGRKDDTPMITIGASAGVIGLTVYYPQQNLDKPVIYPAAFLVKDGVAGDGTQHAASIQCVTIVNGYRGIAADQNNQLPFIRDVYMSVLDYGFRINGCYDCARIIGMHITPAYWAAYEGIEEAKVAAKTKEQAVGVILMRTDGQMTSDLVVRSCHTGISMERNTKDAGETAGYTNLFDISLTDCVVGINFEYNSASVSNAIIQCAGEGAVGIKTGSTTADTSVLRLYDCQLINPDGTVLSVATGAQAMVLVQNSTFRTDNAYAVDADGGVLSLINNDFTRCRQAVRIEKNTLAAIMNNNQYDGEVVNQLGEDTSRVQSASESLLADTTKFSQTIGSVPSVVKNLKAFSVLDYGATGEGKDDDSKAFRDAIAAAKEAGGGIVYVPAGYYLLKSGLTIPTGVELRGIHESFHVTSGEGSVLYITENKGKSNGTAFITMEAGAALRGLTFWYPEQSWKRISAYPWTVNVMGQDCVLQNLCFGNAYRAINMSDADCGGHYVDSVTGCVLNRGIVLDGSTKAGVMMNVHFNPTLYFAAYGTKLTDGSGAFLSSDMAVSLFQNNNNHLTAFTFGETVEEELLFIFNYRARYGMDFTGGFDGNVIGSGVDGSLCGIRVTGTYKKPLILLNFMNDIVPGTVPEGNLAIYVKVSDDSEVRFVSSGASSYNYIPSGLVLLEQGNLVLDGFNAKVTPESGKGAIWVRSGYARVSGVVFSHVGKLNSAGQFVQQTERGNIIDVRVDKGGSLDLYSAIGRRFFREKITGTVNRFEYIVGK